MCKPQTESQMTTHFHDALKKILFHKTVLFLKNQMIQEKPYSQWSFSVNNAILHFTGCLTGWTNPAANHWRDQTWCFSKIRAKSNNPIRSVSEENPDAVCLQEPALDSACVLHFTPSHLRGDWLGVIYSSTVRLFYVLSLWRDVWAWHM